MARIEDNQAAFIVGHKVKPLKVETGPDQTQPEAGEVIIQVAAVGLNPSEWKFQDDIFSGPNTVYPHVLGSDVAGTVVKLGPGVTRFKPGDRVIGHCMGLVIDARHGGFQNFTRCREVVVAKIPDSLPFEQAAVLPLGISTGAVGLFEILKLRLPSAETATSRPTGIVLIWGAASSMGSVGVQLAVAAGYRVVTTASAKNLAYARSLVADKDAVTAFDYADADVVGKIVAHLRESGLPFAGAYDCISEEATVHPCADIVEKLGGGNLALVLMPPKGLPEKVVASTIWAVNPGMVPDHPGAHLWADFVHSALEKGSLRALPEAQVVGTGLDAIQGAMDLQKAGVSARKLVVTL